MKTYIISLKRTKRRRKYILKHIKQLNLDYEIIDAVDELALSDEEINHYCDFSNRNTMSNGAIGCALSHYKAYKKLLKSRDKAAFIIEDDIILPRYINELINGIELEIKESEVILLDYRPKPIPCEISKVRSKELSVGKLLYPMETDFLSTAAYIIDRKATENMVNNIIPIRVPIDSWNFFYEKKYFNSLRVHYPISTATKLFETSITFYELQNVIRARNLKEWIIKNIVKYKIPLLYLCLQYYRTKKYVFRKRKFFILVDKISPIYKYSISKEFN